MVVRFRLSMGVLTKLLLNASSSGAVCFPNYKSAHCANREKELEFGAHTLLPTGDSIYVDAVTSRSTTPTTPITVSPGHEVVGWNPSVDVPASRPSWTATTTFSQANSPIAYLNTSDGATRCRYLKFLDVKWIPIEHMNC